MTKRKRAVHNHGPEDGPGLACREYRIGGRLIGECQLQPDRTIWNCRACWPRLCRCPDRTPPEPAQYPPLAMRAETKEAT